MPAGEIEAVIVGQVRRILQSPEVMAQAILEIRDQDPDADTQQAILTLQSIEPVPTDQDQGFDLWAADKLNEVL